MEQNNNHHEDTEPVLLNRTTDNQTDTVPSTSSAQPKAKGFWRDLFETILMALVLFVLLNAITSRVKVFNISMQPTLKQGYLLLVNKMAYKLGDPKYGDIVVFHYNGDKQEDFIKRVIGLPGDKVDISGGVVRVNGNALTEPYIMEVPNYSGTWTVPAGSLFVLGDNRNHSSDSHQWGFVQDSWVVGKALFIYYPLDAIASLSIDGLVRAAPAQ